MHIVFYLLIAQIFSEQAILQILRQNFCTCEVYICSGEGGDIEEKSQIKAV